MSSRKLERVAYRDVVADPVNPQLFELYDDVGPKPSDPTADVAARYLADVDREIEEYDQMLEQVHASSVHEWGAADGLAVTAHIGSRDLTVAIGVAVDVDGQHISLARGGTAETDPSPPGSPPTLSPTGAVNVTAQGATLSTYPGPTVGDYVVTITFRESYEVPINDDSAGTWVHTPWLRLVKAADFDAGQPGANGVPLASIHLGENGYVQSISEARRKLVALPAGALRVGAPLLSGAKVLDGPAGEVRARGTGPTAGDRGLAITVPGAQNAIELKRSAPNGDGAFRELTVHAQSITGIRNDGKQTTQLDVQNGNLVLGTQGVEGDVVLLDEQGALTIVLDSHDAEITTGRPGKAGKARFKDTQGRDMATIDGGLAQLLLKDTNGTSLIADGLRSDLWFKGALRDLSHPNATPIGHSLLSKLPELTGGGFTTLHQHARQTPSAFVGTMTAFGVFTTTLTVSVTGPVLAYIALNFLDTEFFGGAHADISDIDGGGVPGVGNFSKGFFGDGLFGGTLSSSITFRLRVVGIGATAVFFVLV